MAAPQGAGGSAAAAAASGGPVPSKLPCTILSGFLGSGKTTLLTHILRNKEGLRCAIIVNDMAELNIDASLVKKGDLVQTQERLVEITNGCICCTLRGDLVEEVARLAGEGRYDYCVIESTGIGEPMQTAETFALTVGEGGPPLSEVAVLDTCVTVVDAANLMANFSSVESLKDRGEEADEEDERGVAELLLDQIEFADVILLNKVDLVSGEEQRRLLGLLRALNPGADILPTVNAEVPLARVVNTRRFSMEQAAQSAGWLQSLKERHTPETEEYDISSVIYRARRPFHPGRLHAFLTSHFVLQEPDWSEALAEERGHHHDHSACDHRQDCHHPDHPVLPHHQQQQQQQTLNGPVQQAVLHASQAAQQAATALQAVVQQQAETAGGSADPQQQALLATVAAATSAAAAASSAAAILLSQLQAAGGGSNASAAQAAVQPSGSQPGHPPLQQVAGGAPPPRYHQHGPAVSGEEAQRRQARLTAECGQLCRSKGYVWLATRPDLCGEWSQAGGIVRLGVGGPWYAALPAEAWPQEEEARQAILKDFQEPHGDRRQELVLIGVRLNGKALCAALDACLCSEAEAAAAAEGRLEDPFLEWPSLQEILDDGEDEEEDDGEGGYGEPPSRLSTVEESAGEEEDDGGPPGPAPGAVHAVTYGAAELQECFDACAARLSAGGSSGGPGGGSPPLGVVSWHADWCDACGEAAAELGRLAPAHPGAAFFRLDVEGSAANAAFALEKVVRKPESRRAGAKPVLKSGERFPCITLHYLPSLQPFATLAGPAALEQLRGALREHAAPTPAAAPAAGTAVAAATAAVAAAPGAPAGSSNGSASGLVALKKGAAEFKAVLAAARASGQPVLVVWRSSAPGSGEAAAGAALAQAAAQAAAAAGGRLVVVDADAAASNSNQVLAGALKISFPEVQAYRAMQLEGRLLPAQATPDALLRLAAQLAPGGGAAVGAAGAANGSAAAPPAAAAAAPAAEQPPAAAASPWDPPGGKFAKPGATRRFADGRLGHFFPKMPCLRCGCPWWSSEEWDARCLRCGWDCESSGYDNDSQPLPRHRPKWEQFTAAIREGRTPAWGGGKAAAVAAGKR